MKTFLAVGGNCLTTILKEKYKNQENIRFVDSPFAGTITMEGIFSILDVFNGGFEYSAHRLLSLFNEDNDPANFGRFKPSFSKNTSCLKDSEVQTNLAGFAFTHIDLSKIENCNKLIFRIQKIIDEFGSFKNFVDYKDNYIIYMLNAADLYLSKEDVKYFLSKLKKLGIEENKIIIIQTTREVDQSQPKNLRDWANYRNSAFNFTNQFTLEFNQDITIKNNSFLDFVDTLK